MSRRGVVAVVVLMCCAISARAQWPVDSAKRKILAELSTKYQDALYILDGVQIQPKDGTKLATFTPSNVFDIIVINEEKRARLNFNPGPALVVITSKDAAIYHYQKTLSALSIDYRNYLEAKHNDDSELQYILNSLPLENKGDEIVNLLYRLSPEKITNVSVTEVNGKKTVIIDIKVDE